jgi:hypothetical protein
MAAARQAACSSASRSASSDSASGGSVAVFADHAGAQARAEFLATVTKGMTALTEYDYVQGMTPLRISNAATPEQAAAYEKALQANHVG